MTRRWRPPGTDGWARIVLVVVASGLFSLAVWGGSFAETPAQATLTPTTDFPVYLPLVSRRLGSAPTLPPPVTSVPTTGYICRRPGGSGICWSSASFILARGPGAPCSADQSAAYYLTSDVVNLELYEGELARVHGAIEEMPACPPLLRVVSLVIIRP